MKITSTNQNNYNKPNFGAIGIDGFMDLPHACKSFIKVAEKYPDLVKIGFIREKHYFIAIVKTKLGSKLEKEINNHLFEGKAELIEDKLAEDYIKEESIRSNKNPKSVQYYVENAKKALARFEEYEKDPVNRIVDIVLGTTPPQDKNKPISDRQAWENFFIG